MLSCARLYATPWTAAHQAPLTSTVSWDVFKFISIEPRMLSNHLILCSTHPSSLAFNPSQHSGSFSMSRLFASVGQSNGVSASTSVLPMNIQGWFPLGLTGLILLFKGLWRVFSITTIENINSLVLSLLYGPNLIISKKVGTNLYFTNAITSII